MAERSHLIGQFCALGGFHLMTLRAEMPVPLILPLKPSKTSSSAISNVLYSPYLLYEAALEESADMEQLVEVRLRNCQLNRPFAGSTGLISTRLIILDLFCESYAVIRRPLMS